MRRQALVLAGALASGLIVVTVGIIISLNLYVLYAAITGVL